MIGMAIFMVFIVTLVFVMFSSKTDALIDNDYYQKGLQYDTTYAQKEQVNTDTATPEIRIAQGVMIIIFKSPAHGTLKMIRNADKKMDRLVTINTGTELLTSIPLSGIAKGQWRIQLSWISNGKSYLYEKEIIY